MWSELAIAFVLFVAVGLHEFAAPRSMARSESAEASAAHPVGSGPAVGDTTKRRDAENAESTRDHVEPLAARELLRTFLFAWLTTNTEATPPEEHLGAEEARAHYDLGIDLFRAMDYEASLVQFREAYRAAPTWRIRYNVGQVLLQLGHDDAGRAELERRQLVEEELRELEDGGG
jgi:hypothetical protein